MIPFFFPRPSLAAGVLAATLAATALAFAQEQIVPRPANISIAAEGGPVRLTAKTRLLVDPAFLSPDSSPATAYVAKYLRRGTRLPLPCVCCTSGTAEDILLLLDRSLASAYGPEAYIMNAGGNDAGVCIEIRAASPRALLPAVHSLAQMLSPAFFDAACDKTPHAWTLAEKPFTIVDYPRYGWRSFMLDEARYFFGVPTVKALLDQMALLKMNVLHWHLTDDTGWRIEINKYPKLTSVGARRRDTETGTWKSGKSSGRPHEGFYTQQQLREVVAYAAERGILVVPEIDIPGHSAALCASYPELHLTLKQPPEVPVKFGQNTALDPTNEKVYEVLSDIFDEVLDIFPSPYIHLGGDEVRHRQCWQGEDAINAFMQKKGYTNLNEVQTYFTNRVSQLLASKGRRMLGWNEILGRDVHGDGGGRAVGETLSPGAAVNYWYGNPGPTIEALKKGREVVNSSSAYTYMTNYGKVNLRKAYSFEPDFPGLTAEEQKRLLGIGCHAWTEWVPTPADLYYQVYPRLLAHAETGWTPQNRKDYADFLRRAKLFCRILDTWKIPYAAGEVK